jgi:hypothetical protein
MKRRIIDLIADKAFRKTVKQLIIWIIIFALFIFLFMKYVYFIGDNLPVVDRNKIAVKESQQNGEIVDAERLAIKEDFVPPVGNISVS